MVLAPGGQALSCHITGGALQKLYASEMNATGQQKQINRVALKCLWCSTCWAIYSDTSPHPPHPPCPMAHCLLGRGRA